METGSRGSVRTSRKRRSAPSPTTATQPSGRVIVASPAPSRTSSESPLGEVAAVGELLPDQLLGLALVGGDDRGAGPQARHHRLALGVEHDDDAARAKVLDQARVEVVAGARRKRPGQHADLRAARQVADPLEEDLDLLGADRRPALVDLGLLAGGRVDHREVDPRLTGDPGEVSQHRLLAQLLEHPGAGRPAGEAGGDHRAAHQAQRAGDVDPLAARDGAALDRAVAAAQAKVRHRDGAIDRGVQGHGEDHSDDPLDPAPPVLSSPLLTTHRIVSSPSVRRRCRRHRSAAAISITNAPTPMGIARREAKSPARSRSLARLIPGPAHSRVAPIGIARPGRIGVGLG